MRRYTNDLTIDQAIGIIGRATLRGFDKGVRDSLDQKAREYRASHLVEAGKPMFLDNVQGRAFFLVVKASGYAVLGFTPPAKET